VHCLLLQWLVGWLIMVAYAGDVVGTLVFGTVEAAELAVAMVH
jgi:hypothetical protein